MKRLLLFISVTVICFSPQKSFSQGQANIWYFGAFCGIDFNSGAPVAIPGPINTLEGCASICDSNGVILFSTDGVTVYNSVNAVMATGLHGNTSSTQSAIIIPFPGSNTKYYIFTTDASGQPNGLNYTIVDMTLNGGLGGTVTVNNPLITPTCEKVTAVYCLNGSDIWVITHHYGSNEFYAYKVTSLGIDPPVISASGFNSNTYPSFEGYLKASPDGSKLAACYSGNAGVDQMELYDFNSATGVVSNAISIPSPYVYSYGVSFSPDNTKLYFCSFGVINFIYQYDLTNINFATNPIAVYNGTNTGFGAIQLAPDGKIYIAEDGTSSLSVINNPNGLGTACNFVLNSFPILGTSHYGLPDFFDQLFINNCSVNLGNDTSFCSSSSFILNAGGGSVNYFWQDGSTTQTYSVDTTGTYWVKKTNSNGCIARDTINVQFHQSPNINLGSDTVVCHPGTVTFDGGAGYLFYHWSSGDITQIIQPFISGDYILIVLDSNFCQATDTVHIDFHGPQFSLGNDTIICKNDSVLLTPGSIYKTYFWNDGSLDSLNMVYGAGTFSVTVFDYQGCFARDTILVFVSLPNADLGNDTLLCGAVNYTLHTSVPFSQYHWSNNSSNSTLHIQTTGTYAVSVTDQYGCPDSDTVVITNSNPYIELGGDTLICIYTTAVLTAPNGFASYEWSNGSTTQNTIVSESGTYTVTVTDSVACKTSDAKNILIDAPEVFIGNDTSSCNGTAIVFSAGTLFVSYLWNNNSTEFGIITSGAGTYAVTVTDFNGCTANDTAMVSYADCVDIEIPTAFSPNNDGHNDYFHLLNAQDFLTGGFKIYDRWGQLIFETNNLNNYWDGKYNSVDCEVGVYVFVLSGTNRLTHPIYKKGNVTLIR